MSAQTQIVVHMPVAATTAEGWIFAVSTPECQQGGWAEERLAGDQETVHVHARVLPLPSSDCVSTFADLRATGSS